MWPKRIVCGVDGSEAGFEALRQSRRLLARGGRLVAVTVAEERIAVHAGMQSSRVLDQLRAEADAARQAAAELLSGLDDAEATVVAGRPAEALQEVAARERAELLTVGTHGKSRRAGILVGSVATRTLHSAPCSVLVARAAESVRPFPSAIVAAVDGSPESKEAAALAADLADRFGAALRCVAASGGRGGADVDAARATRADVEIDPRAPLEALEAAAAEADLLVVGNRGVGGIRALGSVSERIAHRAACSVLVVRPTAHS